MIRAMSVFILAGLCEIGGGYLIWQWLRASASGWFGILGGAILFAYGIVATWQSFSNFGKVYAAYGGLFIVMSLLWGWFVDKKMPSTNDFIGAFICLIGVFVMIYPRN